MQNFVFLLALISSSPTGWWCTWVMESSSPVWRKCWTGCSLLVSSFSESPATIALVPNQQWNFCFSFTEIRFTKTPRGHDVLQQQPEYLYKFSGVDLFPSALKVTAKETLTPLATAARPSTVTWSRQCRWRRPTGAERLVLTSCLKRQFKPTWRYGKVLTVAWLKENLQLLHRPYSFSAKRSRFRWRTIRIRSAGCCRRCRAPRTRRTASAPSSSSWTTSSTPAEASCATRRCLELVTSAQADPAPPR